MERSAVISKVWSCLRGRSLFRSFLDGELSVEDRRKVQAHLDECQGCADNLRALKRVRRAMAGMPVRVPPANLTWRLRVLASKELSRRQAGSTGLGRAREFWMDLRLWAHNLMKPLAIPTAGGFASAALLFASLVPALNIPSVSANDDVPTGLYTGAAVKSIVPLGSQNDGVTVEITIDEQGRVVNYSIPNLDPVADSALIRRNVENSLLFAEFIPATNFGHPVVGKTRITFRCSRIDVKG